MPPRFRRDSPATIRQPTVHVPCTRSDCVLPGCINLKLQTMNNKTRKAKIHGHGPKSRCMAQNTEMELTTSAQSAASLWDQDLTDVLNILGDENNPISFNLSENDLLSILDGGDGQLFSPSQFTGEVELRTLQDAPSIHNTPSHQTKVQNQPVMQFQRTLSLGTKMESYDSVLLTNEQVGIEQAFLGNDTGTVQNGGTENSTGATPRGVKRPVDNQYREVESTKKETTGGNTHARKKLRNPTQSTNNLFRILGLILQAFKSPLTSDLEEHYIRVLNRALFEIRNAHDQFLQQSQGNT